MKFSPAEYILTAAFQPATRAALIGMTVCGLLFLACRGEAANELAATPAQMLDIGDRAPPFRPMRWLKGEPVEAFRRGHAYILEFWFVGCLPCEEIMPHMSAIQAKYAERLTVIGVNVETRGRDDPAGSFNRVQKFMKERGDALMQYRVAMDDPVATPVANAWFRAERKDAGDGRAGLGFPRTFIVDQNGAVVWMGNPVSAIKGNMLDRIIENVVNGTYTIADATDDRRQMTDAADREKEINRRRTAFYREIWAANEKQDWSALNTACDTLVEEMQRAFGRDPSYEVETYAYKLMALLHIDESRALAYARSKMHDFATFTLVAGGQPLRYWIPNNLIAPIVEMENLSRTSYQYAIDVLEGEVKNGSAGPGYEAFEAALAKLYYRTGRTAEAVRIQKKAVKDLNADGDYRARYPEDFAEDQKEFARQLAIYRQAMDKS